MLTFIKIKNLIDLKYGDLKDIITRSETQTLSSMENYIKEQSLKLGEQDSKVQDMLVGYWAIFESNAQIYREKMGSKYQAESYDFIIRALTNKEIYFREEKFIFHPQDTIICVRLSSGSKIDFVFGSYEKNREKIASSHYIIFDGSIMSDYGIFHFINNMVQENNCFTKKIASILKTNGILHESHNIFH